MRKISLFISIAVLTAICQKSLAENTEIVNDTFWYTVDKKPIYSQGGGIFRFPDPATGDYHYYWYGVHYKGAETYQSSPVTKNGDIGFVSVTCYKSDDLMNWTFVNDVLTSSSFKNHDWPGWLGRLGVGYIEGIKKYALLTQYNNSVLVALCDTPAGNFVWHNAIDMTSIIGTPNTGDQTVFTDDNGKSYLVYSYGKGRSKIYISEIGVKDNVVTLLDCQQIYKGSGREGNCMFKYKNKYYVCASDLYGWNASNVYYLESDSIYGPYTPTNSTKKMAGAGDDYGHVTQTGFFYTVKGSKEETVIYCGDRWADFAGNGNGYNQWCPLSFTDGNPYFNSLSQWSINVPTGEWQVSSENNYVKNGSFDADRVNIPSSSKPAQDFLRGWTTEVTKGNKVAIGSADSPVLNASNSSSDRAVVTGNRCLNITDKTDFSRKVYQKLSSTATVPVKDGKYAMTAKVKCGSQFNQLLMYAESGSNSFKADIPDTESKWQEIEIKNITISNGAVEIGFLADGASGAWCRIDDVTLKEQRDTIPTTSIRENIQHSPSPSMTEYYTLDGTRIPIPQKGLNIIRKTNNGNIKTIKICR